MDFASSAPEEEVPLRDKILILHYLSKASGIPPSGKLIAFAQLPGCEPYLPVFQKRTIDRLVRTFGKQPENLIAAAQTIGGSKAQYGDVGVVIPALPKVSVTFILWRGDDEFPPSGNILFDRTVENYLDVEDIIVLSEIIVGELCRHAMKTSRTEEGI